MAKKAAQQISNPDPRYIKALGQQKRTLGLLNFDHAGAQNYAKWESKTENIVINCFGENTNQHRQYEELINKFQNTYGPMSAKLFKPRMKDLLTNFIEELNLIVETQSKEELPKSSPRSGVHVNTTVTQTTTVQASISEIIQEVKATEPNPERANEAEKMLKSLEAELKKATPEWSKQRIILSWLLNFSRDAFLNVLPLILQKYGVLLPAK